ncbi:lipase family protein [Corynebacterium xerosis]|uniref:lipase family protein n=1 Tax=Corynebacterium xerosis TaxID=1725 RepID=UPI00366B3213
MGTLTALAASLFGVAPAASAQPSAALPPSLDSASASASASAGATDFYVPPAAESAPGYAPDIDLKGTYAGAPPADLTSVVAAVQENLIVGALGYVVNGFVERYPESRPAFEGVMNPVGRDYLKRTEKQCIVDSLVSYGVPGAFGPKPSRTLTVDGDPLGHHLLPIPVGFLQGQNWITDRFNGIETSGCHLEGWPAARGGDIQIGAVGAMAYFRQLHMFPLGNG